jgi:hypothetical protein
VAMGAPMKPRLVKERRVSKLKRAREKNPSPKISQLSWPPDEYPVQQGVDRSSDEDNASGDCEE